MSEQPTRTDRKWIAPATVVGLAVIMGIPTLGGSFVGGDDHRLVLNHVLVNHPSLEHAVKLFTIWHRDLYQPLALLSFQMEFAIADVFGLFDNGLEGGQWLFHLTNVLLHAANTYLVWILVLLLHSGVSASQNENPDARAKKSKTPDDRAAYVVATVTALLFAVHPLQTEVVAWTNGRMMLLSTMFGLLGLLSFAQWLDKGEKGDAAYTVFWILLSGLSKVRVGLPILLAIVALTRYRKLDRRSVPVWGLATLVTGALAYVNILSTADAQLFSEGAEYLQGSRVVRVLLALAFYAQHMVWPVGLASYYPTPPLVAWSDPATRHALYILAPTLLFVGIACWRSRVARLSVIWFCATIFATLPFFPARNVLAADRYMYLPIIGLFWLLATFAYWIYQQTLAARPAVLQRIVVSMLALAIVIPSLLMCRHIAWFYATPLRKTQRIASLFPTTPRVWERVGWTQYSLGQYDEALESGKKELAHNAPAVLSGAYQLIALATFRQGDADRGIELLQQAIDLDDKSVLAKYRMAQLLDELGRIDDAIVFYEKSVEQAPLSNPTILRLAAAYRKVGRTDDAKGAYEQALANNPDYEVPAIMGLVELEMADGSPESLAAADQRLLSLLSWMPKNSAAWTNLGVVRNGLDRRDLAIDAYLAALQFDPTNLAAALNVAQLYAVEQDAANAEQWFAEAMSMGLSSAIQAKPVHEFYVSQGKLDLCIALWSDLAERSPDDQETSAFLAWTHALSGNSQAANDNLSKRNASGSSIPLDEATRVVVALEEGRHEEATGKTAALCKAGPATKGVRKRLLDGLQFFGSRRPESPWTFTLATRLLIARGQAETAKASLTLAEQRCSKPECSAELERLRELMTNQP